MPKQVYDVVIVGSGAAGGTLAAHLARRGVEVAVVEGGPKIDTRTAFNTHAMPFEFPDRHIPTMRPGVAGFESERSRGLGGKSMTWNAVVEGGGVMVGKTVKIEIEGEAVRRD